MFFEAIISNRYTWSVSDRTANHIKVLLNHLFYLGSSVSLLVLLSKMCYQFKKHNIPISKILKSIETKRWVTTLI